MTVPAQDTAPADASQGLAPSEPAATPEPVDTGTEPTGAEPEVQPAPDAQAQPDGGQGLIASYLEGVDEAHRDVVAEQLEKYRQDSDRRFTETFGQLNAYKELAEDPEQLQTPVALYENLMDKPADTIRWIFDQFSEAGIDLRKELLEEATPSAEEPAAETEPTEDDRPLTVKEWQRLQEEQQATAAQQVQNEQRRETVESWLTEAVSTKGLELGNEDVAIKEAILKHAAQLIPKFKQYGDLAGKHAIDTAVEAFTNRFGKPGQPAQPSTPEPNVADGGTPPSPSTPDLTDQKARKAWMLSQLQGSSTQE